MMKISIIDKLVISFSLCFFILWGLWEIPQWQVRSYRARFQDSDVARLEPKERVQMEKDLASVENEARTTLAQIVGGLVVLISLYLNWRNIMVMFEGKLTERFSKAIELLSSEKRSMRVGGIYALERIASDSSKDRGTVIEVLNMYVRDVASERGGDGPSSIYPTGDIHAAIKVINRCQRLYQKGEWKVPLDFSSLFLNGLDLSNAELPNSIFYESQMSDATCVEANFRDANFNGANLTGATLRGCSFREAQMNGTNLSKAQLVQVDFTGANLEDANLKGADLTQAKLEKTCLKNVNFEGAILTGCDLYGTDLSEALNLECDQLTSAVTDSTTKLPLYLAISILADSEQQFSRAERPRHLSTKDAEINARKLASGE